MSEQGRCPSHYITKRSLFFSDSVQCIKPAGHKSPVHSFTTTPTRNAPKPVTWRWTKDMEETR